MTGMSRTARPTLKEAARVRSRPSLTASTSTSPCGSGLTTMSWARGRREHGPAHSTTEEGALSRPALERCLRRRWRLSTSEHHVVGALRDDQGHRRQAFKSKMVQRMPRPGGPSASELSRSIRFSQPTLSRWLRAACRSTVFTSLISALTWPSMKTHTQELGGLADREQIRGFAPSLRRHWRRLSDVDHMIRGV
jgi:hypothetical protein